MLTKFYKAISSLVVALLIIGTLPLTAFAAGEVGDKANSGSASGGGSENHAYTWNSNQSGYRFTIIDENFKPVSNTVDLVFSPPSQLTNIADRYTSPRGQALSADKSKYTLKTIDQIYQTDEFKGAKYPPLPIKFTTVNGKTIAQAQGEAFKKWFLSGAGSITKPVSSVSIGLSSSTSTSNNSSFTSYGGTTKPSSSSNAVVDDLAPVAEFQVLMDSIYRNIAYADAIVKVVQQGYLDHANIIVDSQINMVKDYVSRRAMHETTPLNQIQSELISSYWGYYQSIGKSYAESVYILTKVINEAFGSDWEADTGSLDILSLGSLEGNSPEKIASNSLESILGSIPLAGPANEEATNEGYALKFLNLQIDGKFLFDLPGTDISDPNKYVTNIMIQNNYSVIVEPIFWFIPAASDSRGLPTSPIYSNYVYGTVGNHVEFAKQHGYVYGAGGGAYGTLLGNLGWRSMFLGQDWVGNGITIKGFSDLVGYKSLSEIDSMMGSNQGVAMHIYITGGSSTQTTRDFTKGDIAHPAPDPSALSAPPGDTKQYKIVKYYEQELLDGTVDRMKYVTPNNPPSIKINDETSYKLQDWFITTSDSDGEMVYSDSKAALPNTRTGTKPEDVKLTNGELTVHLLLRKKASDVVTTGLYLGESEISKAISTMDTSIDNWGPRTFTFTYASMADSDVHYTTGTNADGSTYSIPHSCSAVFGDSQFNYIIENSAAINDKLEANSAGGVFASRMVNNTKSGNASLNGGTNTLDSAEYQTVLWRGQDVPTIASYKEPSTIDLKSLLGKYDKKPAGDRGMNGSYSLDFLAQLSVSNKSDLETHSVHSYDGSIWHTVTHTAAPVDAYKGTVTVNTYRGTDRKSPGKETVNSQILTTTPFGASSSLHSAGFMAQDSTPIDFYPYIRMTYMTTGSSTKTDVNVVSQFYSEILPNDFAEAAWINLADESESLKMSSTQWALSARACNGDKGWNQPNQVLPGGAIYQLGTGDNPTKVALVTWQTIMTDPERSELAVNLPANEYTLTKANAEHKAYVDQAEKILDELRVVQWVNKDPNATNAWSQNGQSIKIMGGNGAQSLSPLGIPGTTNIDEKYQLKGDTPENAANEGDLDIINATDSKDVFFKIFASPDGKVYLAKSIGDINALKTVNGTNPTGGGGVTVTQILNREDDASSVDGKLTGDAKELNTRTKLITNFVKSLERNTGNDYTAWWAKDTGKWYNEAWDGIYVVRKATYLDVGFKKPGIRALALDPKLIPISNGKSDIFEKAFESQFCTNNKSDFAPNKPDGYIGTFEGKDIILPDMAQLYVSKRFYISNATVQDNG